MTTVVRPWLGRDESPPISGVSPMLPEIVALTCEVGGSPSEPRTDVRWSRSPERCPDFPLFTTISLIEDSRGVVRYDLERKRGHAVFLPTPGADAAPASAFNSGIMSRARRVNARTCRALHAPHVERFRAQREQRAHRERARCACSLCALCAPFDCALFEESEMFGPADSVDDEDFVGTSFGRRTGLKIRSWQQGVGSSPTFGTIYLWRIAKCRFALSGNKLGTALR